eukprot:1136916-Pelagomonas_calceolata.AAC.3
MDIPRTAIIPSIAYAFPITPCSENDLAHWDRLALNTIKKGISSGSALQQLSCERTSSILGLDAHPLLWNTKQGAQWPSPLASTTGKHGRTTKSLVESQIQHLRSYWLRIINPSRHTPTYTSRQLPSSYMLRVRQYLRNNNSALDITFQGAPYLLSSILPVLNALSMPAQHISINPP